MAQPGIDITVSVQGMRRMQSMMSRIAQVATVGGSRRALNARWAILAHNWIMRNFASEGGMVGGWKKLSPNTLAGRRKGSGRILQDTGMLRASFLPRWTSEEASVGSALEYALYHEKGTDPYVIKPKKAGGVLRFVVAHEHGTRLKVLVSGKKINIPYAKGGYVSVREVKHPGLYQRRILPTENDPILMRDLLKATLNYLKEQERAAGGE